MPAALMFQNYYFFFALGGLFLGAASVVYLGLRSAPHSFPFPNLNGEFIICPSFGSMAGYLLGRGMGFFILGGFLGWLGSIITGILTERLVFSFCALLCIFIFLFLATGRSPELILARISDASQLVSLPYFFRGLFSSGTLITTVLIGMALVLILNSVFWGMIFFTNFFFGNTLFSLPLLLNMKWSRNAGFDFFMRLILFFCSMSVLIFSMASLLKS